MNEDAGFSDTEYAMEILLHRPKFQDGILALRKKWHIPADGFKDNPANNAWREQLTANDTENYDDAIFALLQTLGLSERWQQGVSMYTQTNNPFMLRVQSSSGTKFKHDGATLGKDAYEYRNARSVWVRVYADSTEREILDEFKNAKELFGPPPKKNKNQKTLSVILMYCGVTATATRTKTSLIG